jgi:hypothetical protein
LELTLVEIAQNSAAKASCLKELEEYRAASGSFGSIQPLGS